MTSASNLLLPVLRDTVEELIHEFDIIPPGRKKILHELTRFVQETVSAGRTVNLNFICTHNSRRSHLAQLWAQAAAFHYHIPSVKCFSGGTEATAFHPHAVAALQEAGFDIRVAKGGNNPVYEVRFSDQQQPVKVFSKRYDDLSNPSGDFAAIMTCSHADDNCPFVPGATKRIAITYEDPKLSDGTPRQSEVYAERVREIGREMLYAFSQIQLK